MVFMLKKMVMAVLIGGSVAAAGASTQAQTVSVGHSAALNGPGAAVAAADQVNVSANDGNLTVSGGLGGGARVGDINGQASLSGTLSAPLPTPSRPVPVPTPAQLVAPVIAPIAAPLKIAKKLVPRF